MTHENKPIKVTIHPDHLTIKLEDLPPEDSELRKIFMKAIPSGMKRNIVEAHGEKLLMLFGSDTIKYTFLFDVTSDFDLLLV